MRPVLMGFFSFHCTPHLLNSNCANKHGMSMLLEGIVAELVVNMQNRSWTVMTYSNLTATF